MVVTGTNVATCSLVVPLPVQMDPVQMATLIPASGRTPKSISELFPVVFCALGQSSPAWLSLLLVRAGDVEENPGPKDYCPNCSDYVNRDSVQCSSCPLWVHRTCAKLRHVNHRPPNFQCANCLPVNQRPSQHSTVNSSQHSVTSFNILQFNANGIGNKLPELSNFLLKNDIKIAAIQETKLNSRSADPSIPNYTVVRRDRSTNRGGGLLFLVHHSVNFKHHAITINDNHTEVLAIKVLFNNLELCIVNIYIPPASSCSSGFIPQISHLFRLQDTLLIGDFNAHDPLWSSGTPDSRGTSFAAEINLSDMAVLNSNSHTRITKNNAGSSPDISLVSSQLITSANWFTIPSMSSDHLPIVISFTPSATSVRTNRKTFTNLDKADWVKYELETESRFASIGPPTDALRGEKVFRRILCKAASHSIPSGRHRENRPYIPSEAIKLMNELDSLRTSDPRSDKIHSMNNQINEIVNTHRRSKWREFISTFSNNVNTSRLWRVLKSIDNKQPNAPNQAIEFDQTQYTNARDIANRFNKQFSSIGPHKSSRDTRHFVRRFKRLPLNDSPQFTFDEVRAAVDRSNNTKAFGPDNLTIFHLKHLGQGGIQYLTDLFNLSLRKCQIPSIWKTSTIIPIPKPGKDPKSSASYRPISLLCPAIKVFESLLLPTLNNHLLLQQHQHGFRPKHSTTSALLSLTNCALNGFNRKNPPDRTIVVALDLTKAFDSIPHTKLIDKVSNTSLPSSVTRWLSNYVRGRKSRVNFRSQLSTARTIHTGVPQGSVISPTLFNFYISDLPPPPAQVNLVSYADDITVFTSNPKISVMERDLNDYLPLLDKFLSDHGLVVSTGKSSVSLITSQTQQHNLHPQVFLRNTLLPLNKTPKILGVTFDPLLTFTPHSQNTIKKASRRTLVLKALTGTNWGQDKETILFAYKMFCRPVFDYASPIWTPVLAETNFKKLQVTQNSALRIATGCHQMASMSHLHQECEILPVQQHCELLAAQYLATISDPTHPIHNQSITPPPGPGHIKDTLCDKFADYIRPHIETTNSTRQALSNIHTAVVQKSIAQLEKNPVINARPPRVNKSEQSLSRTERSRLAQLRSSHCHLLGSYKQRLDRTAPNECPKCGQSPHNVQHLFVCPEIPSDDLGPIDLWNRPEIVARKLQLSDDTSFAQ